MFAGIGGFRSGLTRAGGFRCVGHCEIDKYANASYPTASLIFPSMTLMEFPETLTTIPT